MFVAPCGVRMIGVQIGNSLFFSKVSSRVWTFGEAIDEFFLLPASHETPHGRR